MQSRDDDADLLRWRRLRRGALPTRTLIGFVVAIVTLVLVAFATYRSLATRTELRASVAATTSYVRHVEGLLSTLKDAETGQRGYLLTGEERYLGPYTAATVQVDSELAALRASTDDRSAERLAVIDRLVRAKLRELADTVEARRAGTIENALAIVRTDRGKATMDELRTELGKLRDDADQRLAAQSDAWERVAASSVWITWGGSGVLLFLLVAAGVMTSRDFREQQRQAWLREGENEIATRAAGEQARAQLADAMARSLARFLGAQVAAVYTGTVDRFERSGAYGMDVGSADGSPIAGLVRQVYLDGGIISVPDVPADYLSISTGLGAARPRHLVLAAARTDRRTQGVIELAFTRPATDDDILLLRRVMEPIAVALRTAKYREELNDLLEETQRQAEELQSQQEELRVQNEELEQQTRALQESQARLENQQSELEQINSQLSQQSGALVQQRDDLKLAQHEAQRANAYKSEFLANMSHELRTPLNSSLILAKLLADNRKGNLDAEQVQFAQTIYSAGNDLLTLINDVLDLSKIEAGMLDVRPEPVATSRLADEVRQTFAPIAAEKRLELGVTIDEGVAASIHTDPMRLMQILKNLLSNALKFTEHGGVELRVRRNGTSEVAFDVRDTGIGIAPEQQEWIFDAFRQADGTTNRKYGGTGLGLSISRDLAGLLGGTLTVDSAAGRGSTFTLTIPVSLAVSESKPAPGPTPVARVPSPPRAPQPAPVVAAPAHRGRTILIIEDDVAFAKVLADLARESHFDAVVATTAEEGLASVSRVVPSAVILDVGLPDRSGLSVLDILKHDPKTRHVPVHMISASDYAQTALEMGAVGYEIKPVQREQLVKTLQRLEAKLEQQVRRVLVVEDDATLRDSTCRLIAGNDVECVPVGTAADALAQLASTTFDAMVLDLSLPDKSGFELLDEMGRQEPYGFPPVIVYTGRSLTRNEEQQLRQFSRTIIIKGARSPERLLDEVTLFLHQVEAELPADRQRMLRDARYREDVFEGKRILVVEDDVRNVFALTSVFEPKGAKVDIARNGREALSILEARPGVDLVLMDVMMPEMDGLEATREIRKRAELAKLPIIALTAKAMPDDRERCLSAGANDYIAKPLDVDKLLSLTRVWMPK